MSGATVTLSGIAISRLGLEAALDVCQERLDRSAGGYACFVNVHSLTQATKQPALREALARATYCFADGVPLLWLARAKHAPIATRVCGPDFVAEMLQREAMRRHGLIGGRPGCAETIARRYAIDAVTYSPPMRPFSQAAAREDWQRFLERCPGRRPPGIVWLGLGAPKQELWLATISSLAPSVMFFGVGAAFDFLSLDAARAPALLQRFGLEWTHRLAREPRRLWRRYLVANTRFVTLSVRELLSELRRS